MTAVPLENLLTQQLGRLTQLLELLVQETDALLNRDVMAIEQLLKRKMTLLDEIKLADIGIGRHADLAQLTDHPQQAALLAQCRGKLAECQQHNQHNQKQAEIVAASMARLQQLLQSTSHHNALTYTDVGGTHVGRRLGNLITA
ncbi:flagellar export chaperone FlgN [Ferrimonas senticii]|uniref:flagellar export chaperone FlgN n=1 Tax=Ferrimonas senticii TaxID=394566 RepID=UPI000428EC56|nr:flagellar export chaperone FlgN [Ferrimonas senticii]